VILTLLASTWPWSNSKTILRPAPSLVEDGVVGFCSAEAKERQANGDERHSDSQRSIVHKASHQSPPGKRQASLSIFKIRIVFVVAAQQTSHRPDPSYCFVIQEIGSSLACTHRWKGRGGWSRSKKSVRSVPSTVVIKVSSPSGIPKLC